MRKTLALVGFLCVSAAVAGTWPQKGDTVYISAAMPEVKMTMSYGTKAPDLDVLPPCSPVVIEKITGGRTAVRQANGGGRWLDGDWSAALFRSNAECAAAPAVTIAVHWKGVLPLHVISAPEAH